MAQDKNAAEAGTTIVASRAVAKASSVYDNRGRDLVDSLAVDKEVLSKVQAEELPAELQKMAPAEREAHVKQMASRRAELQKQIGELAAQREQYLKQQAQLTAETGQATLGDAVVATIQ